MKGAVLQGTGGQYHVRHDRKLAYQVQGNRLMRVKTAPDPIVNPDEDCDKRGAEASSR